MSLRQASHFISCVTETNWKFQHLPTHSILYANELLITINLILIILLLMVQLYAHLSTKSYLALHLYIFTNHQKYM